MLLYYLLDCDFSWLALKFDDNFAAATGISLLSLFCLIRGHEALLVIDLDRLSSEVILFNVWHDLRELLLFHILTDVEEKVGALFVDLILIDLLSIEIIVTVPLLLERVPRVTDIVAEAQLTIVVHDAVQVVSRLNVQMFLDEARI